MLKRDDSSRGDTLIEVLLAISVFSLVAVTSMTIMSQSTNAAQRAIEITLVRQQIDKQVEAIRAAHQNYAGLSNTDQMDDSLWRAIKDRVGAGTDTMTAAEVCDFKMDADANPFTGKNVFILNPGTGQIAPRGAGESAVNEEIKPMSSSDAPIYAQAILNDDDGDGTTNGSDEVVSYGLWVEGNRAASQRADVPAAYDFRVRACWFGTGTSQPMQLETTLRLYDVDFS